MIKSIEDLKKIREEKFPYKEPKWYVAVLQGKFNFKFGNFDLFHGVSIINVTYVFPFLNYYSSKLCLRIEFGWLKTTIVFRYHKPHSSKES